MKAISILIIASLSGVELLLGGCVTATQSTAMTTRLATPLTKHAESLSVTVTGGSETTAMTGSKISNSDFAEAIKASVTQSGLFAKIAVGDRADYQLDIQIVRLAQPILGGSFTVTIETTWLLKHRNDQKVLWEKGVTSSFTAGWGDAFVGTTRLRLATEGAARANIQDALAQISGLTLP